MIDLSSSDFYGESFTNKAGEYLFEGVPEGCVSLLIWKEGFFPAFLPDIEIPGASTGLPAVSLVPGGSIQGKVVRKGGRGEAGCVLELFHAMVNPSLCGSFDFFFLQIRRTSGEGGTFSLPLLSKGFHSLLVRVRPGKGEWIYPVLPHSPPLEIVLQDGCSLKGNVLDLSTHEGIGNAQISLPGGSVRTDERGAFFFRDLEEGLYTIRVKKEGYLTAEREISLKRGEEREEEYFFLQRGGVIQGTVLDGKGEPIEGAEAYLNFGRFSANFRCEDFLYPKGRTNPSGSFSIEGIPWGEPLALTLEKEGFGSASVEGIVLWEGEVRELGEIHLERGRRLSGRVFDLRKRGIGEAEVLLLPPLRGGKIRLQEESDGPGGRARATFTAEDGSFSFQSLGAWRGAFIVRKERFLPFGEEKFFFPGEGPLEMEPIFLNPGERIFGEVLSQKGEVLPGARVTARSRRGDWAMSVANADKEGHFILEGLPQETLDLEVVHGGFLPCRMKGVAAGSSGIKAVLSRGLSLSGRVTGKGKPLKEFLITLFQKRGVEIVFVREEEQSSRDGSFEIKNLAPGEYTLSVWAPGFSPSFTPFLSTDGKESVKGISISLGQECSLEGFVIDTRGLPVEGAIVRPLFHPPSPGVNPLPMHGEAVSDREGHFLLGFLASGNCSFLCLKEGFAPEVFSGIPVYPGPPSGPVNLALLSPGCTIEGDVLNGDGVPLARTLVEVEGLEFPYSSFLFTDEKGYFRLEGLPEGSYWITAERERDSETAYVCLAHGESRKILFGGEGIRMKGKIFQGNEPLRKGIFYFSLLEAWHPDGSERIYSGPISAWGEYEVLLPGKRKYSLLVQGEESSWEQREIFFSLERESGEDQRDFTLPASSLEVGVFLGEEPGEEKSHPIRGARVRLWGMGGENELWRIEGETDAEGRCTLHGLAEGSYLVEVKEDSVGREHRRVEIKKEEGLARVDVLLYPGTGFKGRVADINGLPIPFSRIDVLREEEGRWVVVEEILTNALGDFSLSSLQEGVYTLVAEAPGFAKRFEEGVEAYREGLRDLHMELKKGGTLRARIQDAEGNPLPGCLLFLTDERSESYKRFVRTPLFVRTEEGIRTGNGGIALVRDLLPGAVRLRALLEGYEEGFGEVLIREGEAVDVTLFLQRK